MCPYGARYLELLIFWDVVRPGICKSNNPIVVTSASKGGQVRPLR